MDQTTPDWLDPVLKELAELLSIVTEEVVSVLTRTP
jgi:energy-converting hydrogenase A subunit M